MGDHWDEILAVAGDDTPQHMEELLRSLPLPDCVGGVLHAAHELYSPYVLGRHASCRLPSDLGCKPQVQLKRSQLVQEPPSAKGLPECMAWEQIFLRMGLKPLPVKSFTAVLPSNVLATEVGNRCLSRKWMSGPQSAVGAL